MASPAARRHPVARRTRHALSRANRGAVLARLDIKRSATPRHQAWAARLWRTSLGGLVRDLVPHQRVRDVLPGPGRGAAHVSHGRLHRQHHQHAGQDRAPSRCWSYAATKGAIASLHGSRLSNLLAPQGIRVNCVAPGPSLDPDPADLQEPGGARAARQGMPFWAAPGQPAELAGCLRAAGLGRWKLHERRLDPGHGRGADALIQRGGMPTPDRRSHSARRRSCSSGTPVAPCGLRSCLW